jgi:hypothetical protein
MASGIISELPDYNFSVSLIYFLHNSPYKLLLNMLSSSIFVNVYEHAKFYAVVP